MEYTPEFTQWWIAYWASTRNPRAFELPGVEAVFKEVAYRSWIAAIALDY